MTVETFKPFSVGYALKAHPTRFCKLRLIILEATLKMSTLVILRKL